MNLDIFSERAKQLKAVDFGTKVEFTSDNFPDIPEVIEAENLFVESRQRFISNGLIDNLIIHLSKDDSMALGLWILGSYFQKKHKVCSEIKQQRH